MRIFYGKCDYCGWTWEDNRRYRYCPNCGLDEIVIWEHRVPRRLSDVK